MAFHKKAFKGRVFFISNRRNGDSFAKEFNSKSSLKLVKNEKNFMAIKTDTA